MNLSKIRSTPMDSYVVPHKKLKGKGGFVQTHKLCADGSIKTLTRFNVGKVKKCESGIYGSGLGFGEVVFTRKLY